MPPKLAQKFMSPAADQRGLKLTQKFTLPEEGKDAFPELT
jgi:hypothetical protein